LGERDAMQKGGFGPLPEQRPAADAPPQQQRLVAREAQDAALERMSAGLRQLHAMAAAIGDEVEGQGRILADVTDAVDGAQHSVDTATRGVDALLRRAAAARCCCGLCSAGLLLIAALAAVVAGLLLYLLATF
jgi:hypothetical protein